MKMVMIVVMLINVIIVEKKIPYCSNIRGGKHRFTNEDGNDSCYVDKCDYCGKKFVIAQI